MVKIKDLSVRRPLVENENKIIDFRVVKNNPQRFGLDLAELESRTTFIRETRLKITDMKNEIEGPHVNEKLLAMESMPKPSR